MSSHLMGPDQEPRSASSSDPVMPDSNDTTIIVATLVDPPGPTGGTTAGPASRPSALEGFLNNFLREENIKWMSIIGAAIVLASSLMLVTRQWTSWSTELKYLTILAYTLATYFSGRFARQRLGLLTSGRVLELLSLLLLPLCFIALGWLDEAAYSGMPLVEKLLLVLPALALTYHAASRIFNDILRGPQPTFLISYLALAAAGALPVLTHPWAALLLVGGAWLVTSVGVLKVNRHIFWLTEETKQPRVFAFLPIALLGSMFLTLVATKSMSLIQVHWLGTVCVMFAATVLLTARSAAEVFKQRTGNLVRPLPWSLMAPLVIGLVVMAVGVALSFSGFALQCPTTVAIVPTAMLAGGLLCLVAWDTGLSGFVWPALGLITLAYQVTPVLFRTALVQLRDSAAAVMNESHLPLAFYGITYLPLIGLLVLTASYCRRLSGPVSARCRVFAGPSQWFATALTVILFVAALTNLKALAIVAAIDCPLLLLMAFAFRERAYAWFALACLVLCSMLLFPFGHAMRWWDLALAEIPTSVAGLGWLLVVLPGLDRRLARIPSSFDPPPPHTHRDQLVGATLVRPTPVCITVGYCLAFAAAVVWTMLSFLELPSLSTHFVLQWILIGTTFFIATVRTRDYLAALGFWSVMAVGSALIASRFCADFFTWINVVSIGCALLTIGLAFVLKYCSQLLAIDTWRSIRMNSILLKPIEEAHLDVIDFEQAGHDGGGQVQLLATLSVALRDLSLAIALCLAAVVLVPASIAANAGVTGVVPPATILAMTVWGCSMTYLHRSTAGGLALGLLLPLNLAAVLFGWWPDGFAFQHQALLWTIVASAALWITSLQPMAWLVASGQCSQMWLVAMGVISFTATDPIYRLIGLMAVGTITLVHWHRLTRDHLSLSAIFVNVQLLMFVLYAAGLAGPFHGWFSNPHLPLACAFLIPALAVSALVFQSRRFMSELALAWTIALRVCAVIAMLVVLAHGSSMLPWMTVVLGGAGLFMLAEFWRAMQLQKEVFVWSGLSIAAGAVLWLVSLGVLELGMGASQVILALAAGAGLILHKSLTGRDQWQIFARPAFAIGMVGPGILTALAVNHQLTSLQRVLDPVGTLTMFAAAFIYFHQAHTLKNRLLLLLSIVIVNLAICLTWYSLNLHDAQFYCVPVGLSVIAVVQLLKRELPRGVHDPLRYIGALIVLVSPLFQILGGSWIHLASLLVLCVLVILLAIGLRLRALLNVGSAFLLADLVMMVLRSSVDHPSLLWISGLGIGAAVIALAAICERHREQVLSRIRILSAELATWN